MTYPEVLGELHTLTEADEAVQWSKAELVAAALGLEGVTPSQLAHDLGCSASHVRRFRKTYRAFPTPESRWQAPHATFTHHRLCAETSDPEKWLAHCAERDWSTRDLQEAIAVSKAADPVEQAYARAERVVQRLRATWRDADDALRDHLRGALTAFWDTEVRGRQAEGAGRDAS